MHFELSNNKKSFLKARKFINLISLGFIASIILGSTMFDIEGNFEFDFIMGPTFIGAFIIAVLFFLKKQKAISVFDINDAGITVDNVTYNWQDLKKYHLFGESQSEQVGTTSYFSVGNPYKYTPTQIFKIKKRGKLFNSWLNLEVDGERVDELSKVLSDNNITHTSKWRQVFGA